MLSKWLFSPVEKIGFEEIKKAIENRSSIKYIIINTLSREEQTCLIKGTISCNDEEKIINDLMESYETKKIKILIYGKNSCDLGIEKKYHQLQKLGFSDVFVYYGGLFEWLLLQDIYGFDEFPTTGKVIDILRYK